MQVIIFDCETTGLIENDSLPLEQQPQIIELGASKYQLTDNQLTEEGRYHSLYDPQRDLPAIITKITGLTNTSVKGQPLFASAYPALSAFFTGVDVLIAHNLPFDKGMLNIELSRLRKALAFPWPRKQICTVEHTLHIKGFRLNLQKLYQHLFNKDSRQTHSAIEDVEILKEVVQALLNNSELVID